MNDTKTITVPAITKHFTTHAAKESMRYAINGVLVKTTDDKLQVVATDGRRLALFESKRPADAPTDFEAIIPTATLKSLKLGARDTTFTVSANCESGEISAGSSAVKFDLMDGAFPPFKDVIPVPATMTPPAPGEPTGFNGDYLSDAGKLIARFTKGSGTPAVRTTLNKVGKPALFEGRTDEGTLTVTVMPISL